MKKLGKYLGLVFGTFGIITPLIIDSLLFVFAIALERNDAFTALIHSSKATFIVLAIVGSICLIAAVLFIIIKGRSKTISVLDLLIVIVFILAFLMLILFCFQPGNKSFLSVFKWLVVSLVFLGSAALGILRALRIK